MPPAPPRMLLVLLLMVVASLNGSPLPRTPKNVRFSKYLLELQDPMALSNPLPPSLARIDTPEALDSTRDVDDPSYRLPKSLSPTNYKLMLTPHLDTTFTFDGEVKITFNCNEYTEAIVLNGKHLTITSKNPEVFLENPSNQVAAVVKQITEDEIHETFTLHLDQGLRKNSIYSIVLKFSGILNDDMTGFYRSSYKIGNEVRWLATTQFESTGARQAFPCFDEPAFKARFSISILREARHNTLSNMPLQRSEPKANNRVLDIFEDTNPMSVYNLAFVVSDFKSMTNEHRNFTVWSREEILMGGAFSQEIGQRELAELEKYTNIEYKLPKVDQAAIPDFAAGAMENWGLITYREPYLIEQENETDIRIKQFIASTISHELGHQWFGNLVTMDWWSDIWLNEGFATYFEYYITDVVRPDWLFMDQFMAAHMHVAFDTDARENVLAMSSEVFSPAQISNKFDRIAYAKGGSVLRMFEHMLTLPVFQKGLTSYLTEYMYKNTKPAELFRAIDTEARIAQKLPERISFTNIARSWTEQPGVPLVSAVRDYSKGTVTFKQERFFYNPPKNSDLLKTRWWVPLTWVTKGKGDWKDTQPMNWLRDSPVDFKVTEDINATAAEWLLLNPQQTGYYRVNYDLKNWLLLARALSSDPTSFPPANRAQLVNDALSLAKAGKLNYAIALQMTNFLQYETVAVGPWQAALPSINYLLSKLVNTDIYPTFELYMKAITSPAYSKVGFQVQDSDSHLTRLMRFYMASWACSFGNTDCLQAAAGTLKGWLDDDKKTIHPDVKVSTFCHGVRGSGEDVFNAMKKKWLDASTADVSQRNNLLSALSCSSSNSLLTGLLEEAIKDGSSIPKSDAGLVIGYVMQRAQHLNLVVDFIQKNWKRIDEYLGDGNAVSDDLLNALIRGMTSRKQLANIEFWLLDHPELGQDSISKLFEAVNAARVEVASFQNNYNEISDWVNAAVITLPPESSSTETPTTSPSPNSVGINRAVISLIGCLVSFVMFF